MYVLHIHIIIMCTVRDMSYYNSISLVASSSTRARKEAQKMRTVGGFQNVTFLLLSNRTMLRVLVCTTVPHLPVCVHHLFLIFFPRLLLPSTSAHFLILKNYELVQQCPVYRTCNSF